MLLDSLFQQRKVKQLIEQKKQGYICMICKEVADFDTLTFHNLNIGKFKVHRGCWFNHWRKQQGIRP